jgi:uncharacterized phage infection (PIP) family protein YhgE
MKQKMIQAYAQKSGKPLDEIERMMKAETFLSAQECVRLGFANYVTNTPKACRKFELETMPHGVYTALFSAGSGGNNNVEIKDKKLMTTQAKVAATAKQIKAAFPKAKAEFIVRCMEKEYAMEEVATELTEEVLEENETLSAKVKAMEEELTALKAKAQEEEEMKAKYAEMEQKAQDMEEQLAKFQARGMRAVTQPIGTPSKESARAQWQAEVESHVAKGLSRANAVIAANRAKPGLREKMIAECNAR